jgi:hypothetical protein
MKKMNLALLLLLAAGAGVGAAFTIVDRIGFSVTPPSYASSSEDVSEALAQR